MDTNEDLLRPVEVASILRLRPKTVRQMIKSRRLPGLSIGRRLYVSRAMLDGFLAERAQEQGRA